MLFWYDDRMFLLLIDYDASARNKFSAANAIHNHLKNVYNENKYWNSDNEALLQMLEEEEE